MKAVWTLALAAVVLGAFALWSVWPAETAPEAVAEAEPGPGVASAPAPNEPAGVAPAPAAPETGPAEAPPAVDPDATPDQAGRAMLAQGLEAKADGHPDQARERFEAAAAALAKAVEQAGDRPDPWTLQGMAQVQLELGHDLEAIGWADRALQQLRLGDSDDYRTFKAASLTMNAGIVYYRAGQPSTGIAYMDQAISMAPTEFDRADFVDLKRETLGGN